MMFWFKKQTLKGSVFLKGATDIHCHLLPAVDDGMATLEESLELLSLEEQAGVKRVYLTPHNMGLAGAVVDATSYGKDHLGNHSQGLTTEQLEGNSSVAEIQRRQQEYEAAETQSSFAGEPKGGFSTAHLRERFELFKSFYTGSIELCLASEYMMNKEFLTKVEKKDILTYSDGVHVLVETSYFSPPVEMNEILYTLVLNGYRPIIAHPERYRYMSEKVYKALKNKDYEIQLNVLALCGYYGREVYEKAMYLLEKGYYNFTGSDFHRLSTYYHQIKKLKLKGKKADLLLELFANNSRL